MNKINEIMKELDKWVFDKGSRGYTEGEDKYTLYYSGTKPIDGIQQNRNEIKEFTEYLLNYFNGGTILEVGLGYYGSTHFLWRMIFDKVITIENQNDRIKEFGLNTQRYYGKWVLDDGKSYFIHGNSNDPKTIGNVYELTKELDIVFVDALHSYESVLTDWLVYSPRVKSGGMVAFHDCEKRFSNHKGVAEFLDDLESGKIDGKRYEIKKIVHSKTQGIAWYIK
jgi:cephalosporin hydroxylase|tara:strand:+ start:850 stop:1521 length:672 start_codon:yes stop_codon:yes gene_type:complete